MSTYIPGHTCLQRDPMIRFLLHPPGWPAQKLLICCCHWYDTSSSTIVYIVLRFCLSPRLRRLGPAASRFAAWQRRCSRCSRGCSPCKPQRRVRAAAGLGSRCSDTVGLEGGDGVDDDAVVVATCGRNEGCRQVVGRLDCRKSTLEEGRDVVGLRNGEPVKTADIHSIQSKSTLKRFVLLIDTAILTELEFQPKAQLVFQPDESEDMKKRHSM